MSQRLKVLREERATLDAASKKILDTAESENRSLTAEQRAEWDRMDARINEINDEIDKREKQEARSAALSQSRGREADPQNTGPSANAAAAAAAGEPVILDYGRGRTVTLQPGTPEHARCSAEYKKNFRDYIVSGGKATNGLHTGSDPKGGYLAPPTMVAGLIKTLDNRVFMRQLATVLPPLVNSTSLGALSLDSDPNDADWTDEVPASDISEDDNVTFGKREFKPQLLTKMIKESRKLIRSATIDIEAFLIERLGYKFGVTEEQAYMTGNGAKKPLGIFVASTQGISTGRDTTCASTTEPVADDLINALYSLKEGHMANATGVFHRDMVKRIRKLKTGDGQYIWAPGLAGGQPNTILDRPYVMSEYAPNTFTTGQYIGIWGNFKEGYWIADALGQEVEVLDQLFALKNQTGILMRKETDGAPVLEEAFARIKLA